ncbi:MAG: fluoride efflux transporter CrcB [Firmicutes bacterium HGW-Firmicutes-14]|nr:MAG: fluoride efflux transporter CrcB [Firmicutes bacterium HGW-Firmicutes-14]
MEYLYIGIGGIFGAVTRYGLSKWIGQRWRGDFPLATFCINITGSFILGVLVVVFSKAGSGAAGFKNFATAGFLGAYTTYSTFAYEIVNLVENGERGTALKYLLASIIVGLMAAFLGISLAEYLSG